jgi:hypothetical protein
VLLGGFAHLGSIVIKRRKSGPFSISGGQYNRA